jgi:hypothetical protein
LGNRDSEFAGLSLLHFFLESVLNRGVLMSRPGFNPGAQLKLSNHFERIPSERLRIIEPGSATFTDPTKPYMRSAPWFADSSFEWRNTGT